MKDALFLVLPAVDEPLPMVVLEAHIAELDCGLVVGESVEELAEAIGILLTDVGRRKTMASNAYATSRSAFTTKTAATALTQRYSEVKAMSDTDL